VSAESSSAVVPSSPTASAGTAPQTAAHAELVEQLLDALDPRDRKLARDLIQGAVDLVAHQPATLDLKIAAAAVNEMDDAYQMFKLVRGTDKVTVFGSARTQLNDPLYEQARKIAAHLAGAGWMVITGAGPGIMHAAMEGAGREQSIGVSIRLPNEQGANPVIAGDHKYVSMKYFFTRKLMLIKESKAFICLPGGFGTLDETFELLTLTQTGKGVPVPIVFLDVPGDPYWETVHELIEQQLVARGLASPSDTELYMVTDSCDAAIAEVTNFYRNYDSLRYVGSTLVIRMRIAPTDAELADLNQRFGHLCSEGSIRVVEAFPVERKENDLVDLPRLALVFGQHKYGDLRAMIDAINEFGIATVPA
jgi:uncharacterized protein (TIGR00730 family)